MPGYDKEQQQLTSFQYSMAGAASGLITRFTTQPFDVIKIRFQLQVEPISKKNYISKYKAVYQATKTVFVEEGIVGLWKGHNPGQLLSISYGIAQFQAFELLTKLSDNYLHLNAKSPDVHFVCGSLAGIFGTLVSFPFDVVRTRLVAQGNDKMYTSMYHAFITMLKKEGPTAYFKGITPSLILIVPQNGITFLTHNVLYTKLIKHKLTGPENKLSVVQNLVIGSVSGIVSKSAVYPLDLARKRLQLQGFQEGRVGFGKNFYCRGMANCLVETVKNEGVIGLYKGMVPSIFKAAIVTALYFTVYDLSCQFFSTFQKIKI